MDVLSKEESELLEELTGSLGRRKQEEELQIQAQFTALRELAKVIEHYPSIVKNGRLGRNHRSEETLVEKLCSQGTIANTVYLPTKVLLGKNFLQAKVNFLLHLRYTADSSFRLKKYSNPLLELITRNIFSLMIEELLFSLVGDLGLEEEVRQKAARKLVYFWDTRFTPEERASVPILTSMWISRQKLCPIFGSMMGMSEVYQISKHIDPVWFDFLKAYEEEEETFQALEEFIFNLSHEEILQIRTEMEEKDLPNISRKRIEAIVGRHRFCPDLAKVDPREVLRFYKERKSKADHRRHSGTAGPQRTIEEFLTLFLLENSHSL